MAKQAVDARYVDGRRLLGVSALAGEDPFAAGGELHWSLYPQPWLETRLGLVALGGTAEANLFGGLTAGMRLQSPSRLAPFLGAGAAVAPDLPFWINAALDDDDGDHEDDVFTETKVFISGYPEAGAHFWLTPHVRLTGSAAYHFTTTGRDDDLWMFGVGLSFLERGDYDPNKPASYATLREKFADVEIAALPAPKSERSGPPSERLPTSQRTGQDRSGQINAQERSYNGPPW
jgi:hypothetical protein